MLVLNLELSAPITCVDSVVQTDVKKIQKVHANSSGASLETQQSNRKVGLLPERIITVFGLESSGTTFVHKTLAKALRLGQRQGGEYTNADQSIWVQHISLPFGSFSKATVGFAGRFEPLEVVPVFVPEKCSQPQGRSPPRPAPKECEPFGPKLIPRPGRFFVNVTSHIQWYRERGVDARAVVVVRDPSLHFKGILKTHCPNETAAYEQFVTGRALLKHAMQHLDPVVVSYEALMTLQTKYLQEIYNELNISTSSLKAYQQPTFSNGNVKYYDQTPQDIQQKLLADMGNTSHVAMPQNQYEPKKPGEVPYTN
jgi:hypothetical protein